jgi:tetratricopeptide (TPR) repeat protein
MGARATVCIVVCLTSGCAASASSTPDSPGRKDLRPVSLPDLSRADRSVQQQALDAYASLAARLKGRSPDPELGAAYGALGMVLQASEQYDAAEPALLNAQTLVPGEIRWPYFLGHVYQTRGQLADAKVSFARALELRPDDPATLIWLGRIHQDEGSLDQAAQYFERAKALAPDAIAVLAGLGRIALARRDYADAARHFERALEIDGAAAESLHAPLAVAYRALGDPQRAGRHERLWANRDVLVPDPLSQELDMLLDNGLSNELRGVRALEASDWKTAAAYFERGLAVTPENTPLRRSLQHKLGTALHLGGDTEGAMAHFQRVVDAAPAEGLDEATAKAHYSLGVLLLAGGQVTEAFTHLEGAVRYQPRYLEARMALAESLRRNGQVAASIPHYESVLEVDPAAAQASMGHAFALIRLGRYQEAKRRLDAAVEVHRDRPEFAHMLARLLAVAPDNRVRDGARAMRLVDELLKGTRTTDLGETLAMALAETGQYEKAAAIQRDLLAVVRRGGGVAAAERIERNLQLYERRRPSRTFWESDSGR